jgi:xanthine dehydrogenase accessory factor
MVTSALGPALGQCCGGSLTLLYERFDRTRLPEIESLARQEADGPFMTRGEAGPHGIARSVTEDPQAPLLERFGRKRWPLYLFGAGHTGRAVVLALAPHPFAVVWVENRADAFPGAMPGNATPVRTEVPPDILARAPDESLILVMTHSHALDQEIVQSALAQDRFRYVGLIGSASKRARFVARMASAGLPRARLERDLVCPVGLPQIRSKAPEAIAAGIAADLLIRIEAFDAVHDGTKVAEGERAVSQIGHRSEP